MLSVNVKHVCPSGKIQSIINIEDDTSDTYLNSK